MLFTDRSILTMVHGLVFGGGALLVLAAALFALRVLPAADGVLAWRRTAPDGDERTVALMQATMMRIAPGR